MIKLLLIPILFIGCMTEPTHPDEKKCKESYTPVSMVQTDSGYVNTSHLCDTVKVVNK